jgi:Papain-like cysteine protease AvrRpt2
MSRVLESSRIPIQLDRDDDPTVVAPIAKRASQWARLTFEMQHQCRSEWCWAATSVSVSRYYDPESDWTQCAMVDAEKGLTGCCNDATRDDCNEANVLDGPLSRAEVFDHKQRGSVSSDSVRGEIDSGRPLALRIGWAGGHTGHFVVIDGYRSDGVEWVAVDDPLNGVCDLPVSTLTDGAYQQSGTWTHTYFTRPPPIQPALRGEAASAVGRATG